MKKNKKIIIIIITILLCVAMLGITIHILLSQDKEETKTNNTSENKEDVENNIPIEYKYTEDGPAFLCSNEKNYTKTYSYDKGEYVYCLISYELRNGTPDIKEIWFENTHDEDIEYIEITELDSDWKVYANSGVIHLTTEKPSSVEEGQYKVKFRIIPSTDKETLQINFKNIKFKNVNDEYYQTDDSVIELSINKERNYQHKTSEKNDEIIFYKFNKEKGYEEINKYTCKNEKCYEYVSQCTSYIDQDKGKILILDGNEAILYDFNKGVIGTYSHNIDYIDNYFIVQDTETQKYGIIDLNGKVIKELTSDGYGKKISKCINENTYSIEYDQIIEKKDNKYGIVKISKDEALVEHQFDDIRLYNNKYFKAKQEAEWYLYSIDTKEKVLEEGFKELFIISNQIIITQIDNYLYIKDYKGNNIIEDKIEVLTDYNEGACCGASGGYAIYEEEEIINIFIDEPISNNGIGYVTHKYEYNIKDKQLIKINSQ